MDLIVNKLEEKDMSFFARLKTEVNGKKVEEAVFLGKRVLYPNDPRWIRKEDSCLADAQADERIDILENMKEFNDFTAQEDKEIEDFVRSHHKTVQKKVEEMIDQPYLKKLLKKAQELNKETISKTIEERLDYLNTPHY
jgi:hypothetical protein